MSATSTPLSLLLSLLLLLFSLQTQAKIITSVNLTGILDKQGQFTTFMRLLTDTQATTQIQTQIRSSTDGMTLFAPTDNAFNNLKPGTLNAMSVEDQVRLVQFHVIPKYYTLANLLTVSNPVRTQATSQQGGFFGLNFTGLGNQVNVSTGSVNTQISNVLSEDPPLAVYQVDKVLLPRQLFGVNPPSSAPTPAKKSSGGVSNATESTAKAPSGEEADDDSGAVGTGNGGFGLVAGLGLFCMAALF